MSDTETENDEKRKLLYRQLEEDVRAVMELPAGRRFLWNIINGMTGTFGGSYTAEAVSMAFNEGRRSVGIALMKRAQECAPAQYSRMLVEQLEAQRLASEAKAAK